MTHHAIDIATHHGICLSQCQDHADCWSVTNRYSSKTPLVAVSASEALKAYKAACKAVKLQAVLIGQHWVQQDGSLGIAAGVWPAGEATDIATALRNAMITGKIPRVAIELVPA